LIYGSLLIKDNIKVELEVIKLRLHNPWAGGYYPVGLSLEESNKMMADEPEKFKEEVQKTLVRHANAINNLHAKGMYFFDYGNAFLLEARKRWC
jgi:urocanate hydratase